MDVNAKGVFLGCKYGIPALRRAGGGSIINTASFVALLGAATPQIAYTASKGAVLALTRELAVIHARENIRVNALCPGPLRTELLMKFLDTEEKKQRRLVHIPMGRFGEAAEIAKAALFLASDESSFVTGRRLPRRRRHHRRLRHAGVTRGRRCQRTVSPVDGSVYADASAGPADIDAALARRRAAQRAWRATPVAERAAIVPPHGGVDGRARRRPRRRADAGRWAGPSRTRPTRSAAASRSGRAHGRRSPADALADVERRRGATASAASSGASPLGVVLVLAPWNYPCLVLGQRGRARAAGRQRAWSSRWRQQTPLVAERYAEAFAAAGLPAGVFQYLHADHDGVAADDRRRRGSASSRSPARSPAATPCSGPPPSRFIATSLELGGKDPAYVRADAAARARPSAELVDGAFFNAGQSCCGVERIYVHRDVYDEFVDALRRRWPRRYVLGDPLDPATTLGPMVRARRPPIRARPGRRGGRRTGARALVDRARFPADAAARLPRAAGAGRRRPPHAGHDRGDVRPGRRHHGGRRRRRGGRAHERQRLRADRVGLDGRRRRRRRASATGSRPARGT